MAEISTVRIIRCPYLTKGICSACEKPYLPSPFELEEYCRRFEHRKCPFYSGFAKYARTCFEKN